MSAQTTAASPAATAEGTPTPLTYCGVCGSPVYRLVHVPSGEPVTVDWLPLPYGGHVRHGEGRCTLEATPSADGAYIVAWLARGTCCYVLPGEVGNDGGSEAELARAIYHQDHSETCAIWRGAKTATEWGEGWADEDA